MKNILITGASQGIGKATAIEAAKAKMFVGINYNQNLNAAEECLKLVRDSGGDGIILKCDVAINKSVKAMFNEFLDKAGTIDGVFNNAGVTGPISQIQDLSPGLRSCICEIGPVTPALLKTCLLYTSPSPRD